MCKDGAWIMPNLKTINRIINGIATVLILISLIYLVRVIWESLYNFFGTSIPVILIAIVIVILGVLGGYIGINRILNALGLGEC